MPRIPGSFSVGNAVVTEQVAVVPDFVDQTRSGGRHQGMEGPLVLGQGVEVRLPLAAQGAGSGVGFGLGFG